MILAALANVSLILYWEQIVRSVRRPDDALLYLILAALDVAVYASWEELSLRGLDWLTSRRYGVVVAAWDGFTCR